jgi:hypothetical protein
VVVAGQEAGLAREFNIPNDHGHPQTYSQHYSQYVYVFGPDLMAPAEALATATCSTRQRMKMRSATALRLNYGACRHVSVSPQGA